MWCNLCIFGRIEFMNKALNVSNLLVVIEFFLGG